MPTLRLFEYHYYLTENVILLNRTNYPIKQKTYFVLKIPVLNAGDSVKISLKRDEILQGIRHNIKKMQVK